MNKQPIEKSIADKTDVYELHSVWRTIQGEGPFAGLPCVFVRLAGCNLQCPTCDTDYTSSRGVCDSKSIRELVDRLMPNGLVVITGGEPFRQDMVTLVRTLTNDYHHKVQIETNGTYALANGLMSILMDELWEDVESRSLSIVVSPKTPTISQSVAHWSECFKYVLRDGEVDPDDGLPTQVLGGYKPARPPEGYRHDAIYIQPEDQQNAFLNKRNERACIESCMKFGYRFSLQLHKHLGLQ